MFLDLTEKLSCIAVIDDCSAGYLDGLIFSVFAEGAAIAAFATVGGEDMPLVLEVKECP